MSNLDTDIAAYAAGLTFVLYSTLMIDILSLAGLETYII